MYRDSRDLKVAGAGIQIRTKSLSSAALYGTSNAIQLPFRGLKEEFVVTRTREAIMYRWRHDQVLKVIAGVVSEALKSNRFSPGRHKVIFVRAGSSKQPQTKNKVSMLSSAPDWQLLVDLERQTKFPAHIVETKLRPDLVMFSNSTKKVIMWELSVPWEENMESTHERKIAKYEPLVEQC